MYPAEFEYSAKNGRRLKRTYDHNVVVRPDGSARVTTEVTIVNPDPVDPVRNPEGGLAFITMYGAAGAVLDTASDPLGIPEAAIAGHPGVGWFKPLPPGAETAVTVVWEVPKAARPWPDGSDGQWEYSLRWMRLPDHKGDELNLSVELPQGWSWDGAAPPDHHQLETDIDSRWAISVSSK